MSGPVASYAGELRAVAALVVGAVFVVGLAVLLGGRVGALDLARDGISLVGNDEQSAVTCPRCR